MEEKERYELTDTDCIFDTERDIVVSDVCDVITNADIITDLLNQQDKRIKELEQENRDLEDDHNKLIDKYDKQYNDLCKEIQFHSSARERFVKKVKELKQQLAITEKALELACEPRDDWGGEKYSGTEYDNYYDYFKQQAKEMLENE